MKHLSLLALMLTCVPTMAEDWPQWRGAHHDGVSAAKGVATTWGSDENIAWRLPLPGPAGSTPVVAGGRVFLTSVDEADLVLLAFSTDGQQQWRRVVGKGNRDMRGDEGNFASPSPVTDGRSVACLFGQGTLACFSAEGEPKWEFNIEDRYGKLDIQFGYASTPVLHDGRLYLQMIHGEGDPDTNEAQVFCLDFETGEEVWRCERLTGAKAECEHSYASPTIYSPPGAAPLLLTHGGDFLVAYTLDGKEAWRLGGFNDEGRYHPTLRFVSSPAVGDGLIVVPSAKRGAVVAVSPGGSGEVAGTSHELWRMPQGTPDVPSPLIYDGLVYLCREDGVLTCVEAQTGDEVYTRRLQSDRYRSSPVGVDGKVYCCSRKGVVSVIRAGREFELLAKNDLGEAVSSSLAIADGVIYLRTFDALYAIADGD
ncbi:outer membrane biogenesis protein BamB [Pirellulimonas nuda]|uniref:Outer membrane biogenesis protein BamB n=1 Tax=Pirellulimonas nuda TaxID=2528009 RepID=A0A518D9Y0_9BACT|nr:PQQ-binding-like beta-propeller repeat protein [Pirellulimonas nuda]QDU88290.1 outer membrane biogenesis protein BamB [Pirellulimonas nuda]